MSKILGWVDPLEYTKRIVKIDTNCVGCTAGDIELNATQLSGKEIEGIIFNHCRFMAKTVFDYEYSDSDQLVSDFGISNSGVVSDNELVSRVDYGDCGFISVSYINF